VAHHEAQTGLNEVTAGFVESLGKKAVYGRADGPQLEGTQLPRESAETPTDGRE
jgi:hypothetical protein